MRRSPRQVSVPDLHGYRLCSQSAADTGGHYVASGFHFCKVVKRLVELQASAVPTRCPLLPHRLGSAAMHMEGVSIGSLCVDTCHETTVGDGTGVNGHVEASSESHYAKNCMTVLTDLPKFDKPSVQGLHGIHMLS